MTDQTQTDDAALTMHDDRQNEALERLKDEMLSLQSALAGALPAVMDDRSSDASSRMAAAVEAIFSSPQPVEHNESTDDPSAAASVQTGTVAATPAIEASASASTTAPAEAEAGKADDSAT